ncbi:DedA family protein [Pseudolysinimonas sp.]|uniref:DedA family protein n=1 Tax=Pseudolysinimonas sp. TaxID=2680009 RepID=UPI003F7EC28B
MTQQLEDLLAHAGPILFYLAVWGLVFVGTALFVGIVLPFVTGDSLLFAAGIVSGLLPDRISIVVLAAGVAVAAIAGDQVGFLLGRRLGRPYLTRRTGRWTRTAIRRTERFYELFGWWSVVIGRYIPWGRVLVPPIAGIGGMAYWRFLTANVVGAFSWGVLITVIGYFAASDPTVRPIAYAVAGIVIVASVVAGIRAWALDRRRRDPAGNGPTDAPHQAS